jgi:SAM-dependent methyltransferase
MRKQLTGIVKRGLPYAMYRRLVLYSRNPPVGRVDFGDLGTVKPISRDWGLDRGQAVDRYYIEQFLMSSSADIRGHVLEIGTDMYTLAIGVDRVSKSDILHVSADHPRATIVADLTAAEHVPSNTFDCIIFTQTLQFIFDIEAVVRTLHRLLKPGGVLLTTGSGIAQISRYDMDHWGDYWRFTSASMRKLFMTVFPEPNIHIVAYGNVLAAIAFLHGLASEDLSQVDLDYHDQDYELLLGVRSQKPENQG